MLNFDDKKFEEKTLAREEIFSGKIFHVVKDVVSLHDGQESFRELVFHNGGTAIAPVHNNKMILVGQYRKALEKFIFEIPAGKLEKGEEKDPKAAALRELEEETGYLAQDLTEITAFYGNEKLDLSHLPSNESRGGYGVCFNGDGRSHVS